jgi:hypothetical protein
MVDSSRDTICPWIAAMLTKPVRLATLRELLRRQPAAP